MSEIIYQHPHVERGPEINILAGQEHVGWQIRAWGIEEAHAMGVTGSNVIGAVGDTGVSRRHLDDELSGVEKYRSFVSGEDAWDLNGHGSHCLGIRFAKRNGEGLIGVAPDAKGLSGKCLGNSGSGSDSGIARFVDWAVEEGAMTISLSLGSPQRSQSITAAIRRAHEADVIVVCASGNDGRNNDVDFPAAGGSCVCGSAIDHNLQPARFSDAGPSVKDRGVCGAGVDVWSTTSRGFARMSGTSMATPHVASLIDLAIDAEIKFLGRRHTKTFLDVLELVKKWNYDIGASGHDPKAGLGTFDILAYCKHLKKQADDDDGPVDGIVEQPNEPVGSFIDRGYEYTTYKKEVTK